MKKILATLLLAISASVANADVVQIPYSDDIGEAIEELNIEDLLSIFNMQSNGTSWPDGCVEEDDLDKGVSVNIDCTKYRL